MEQTIKYVSFRELELDPQNPRLPEEMLGKDAVEQLPLFYREYNLDELAKSYIENGFFPSEALIVSREDNIVLEGNRRLAALKYLHHDDDAALANLPEFEILDGERDKLRNLEEIPVIYTDDRESIAPYLGFRHINGPKQWLPSAKARYIWRRVRKLSDNGAETGADPFYIVGREIGSNRTGVRNQYLHYSILQAAASYENNGPNVTFVLNNRFGVWQRLNNSTIVLDHINFDLDARDTVDDIDDALMRIDDEKLAAIIGDLTPKFNVEGKIIGDPLLKDSRLITDYLSIIEEPAALSYLRESRDFERTLQMISGDEFYQILDDALLKLKDARDTLLQSSEIDKRTDTMLTNIKIVFEQIKTAVEFKRANM